jgi:hypothetical protein
MFAGTSATSSELNKLACGLTRNIQEVLEGSVSFSAHKDEPQMSGLLNRLYKLLSNDFVQSNYGDSKKPDSKPALGSFLKSLVLLDDPDNAGAHFQYPEACQVTSSELRWLLKAKISQRL